MESVYAYTKGMQVYVQYSSRSSGACFPGTCLTVRVFYKAVLIS